jgi:hypothetical protein
MKILSITALLAGVLSSSGSVTVQGWWHYGELPDYYADSSGNGRRFSMAYSSVGGGNAGAGVMPFGVGTTVSGFVSTNCVYWTPTHASAAGMWYPATSGDASAEWNPPATNYIIECWVLPEDTGIAAGRNSTWFFASGSGDFSQPSRPSRTGAGGVYLMITNDVVSGVSMIGAFVIANAAQGVTEAAQIGDFVEATTNRWMHVAVVNDGGTNTFYVDGVPNGAPQPKNTIPNGNIFAGCTPGTTPTFAGYLDELRISTFESGQFSVSDLLLRPPGPSILNQPEDATAWTGGTAPFEVVTAYDTSTTYQWRKGGANITGGTGAIYVTPALALSDSGGTFDVVASSGGSSTTSSVATLTVVDPNPSNVSAYRNVIQAETSLLAYFPVDSDTGTTVVNAKDSSHNGTLEGDAYYDGRTNRAFGVKAVGFAGTGDVMVPYNAAFEFTSGSGTIEAVVRMNRATLTDPAIITEGDGGGMYYLIGTGKDGNSLVYSNDTVGLTWPLSQTLLGRRIHLAFVFENGTSVTPYINGEALATKTQPSFGFAAGSPLFIGGRGPNSPGYGWNGAVDEVAIYSTALSQTAIQTHYANYFYGTNTAAPTLVSVPPSRTLLAGGSPILTVVASGTPPLSYVWSLNGTAISGGTTASLQLKNTTTASSGNYTVKVINAFGDVTSDPIVLTFVAPPAGYATSVLNDHPIAYWRQSDTSGSTMLDSAGFFDGTYSGSVALGEAGVFGSDTAVKYTGGKAEVPWSERLNSSGAFSVECWAKSLDNSAIRAMFSSQNRSSGRSGYALYHHANVEGFEVHMGDSTTVTMFLYGAHPVETGVWYHVVLTYDGTTATLYVDGEVGPDASASGNYNPNSNKPLTFGQRTDGQWLNNGLLDEVAFYDYALSATQVRQHWSHIWTPAVITQQPVGVSATEGATISLTAAATGIPNTYQWTKGGVALTDSDVNFDGTLRYPNGVTNTTLTIAQVVPGDSGQYRIVASNPVGNATSDPATVTIVADTTPPVMTEVIGLGTPGPTGGLPNLVKVVFSKRIIAATASTAANYVLNGGVTVSSATIHEVATGGVLGADWREVILSTSGLTPGQEYTLTVSNLKDQTTAGNTMVSASMTFKAPKLLAGYALWDYYYLGADAPPGIGTLYGSAIYPSAPMTNVYTTNFDSTLITGGDLLNTAFGALGEHYGCSLSGWLTPTVSGSYRFFLASDDASQLLLSPNADPNGAALIAEETSYGHGFVEPGENTPYVSEPQALVAGTSYFIRAAHVEGGGGDYVKVAWRMEGDTTKAADLKPIPASFISSYAPEPPPLFGKLVLSNGKLTITWTGGGTLEQSTDLDNWTDVPGNPTSPTQVDVTGGMKFYRVRQ